MANRDLNVSETANGYRFFWFSELLKLSVRVSDGGNLGKLHDLVFTLSDPYPEAAGIYIECGREEPTAFVPWDRVVGIDKEGITVQLPEDGKAYLPFVDQPGWMLVNEHLMGRTILDTDGRKVEVVNDVHLLESKGRLIIVDVDTSFNGFLRKWGFGNLRWINDRLISWRYVQPFSLEDAKGQAVSLSVTKEQARDLPVEDLADVLEVLHGEQQEAFFSSLDAEKAAETLMHAEPRARRQLMEDLSKQRAGAILAELSTPQLADLFSDLPLDDVKELMELLPEEKATKIRQILREDEVEARELMSSEYLSFSQDVSVAEALHTARHSGLEPQAVSYLYIVLDDHVLAGVVDIRELILAADDVRLSTVMSTSVVSVEADKTRRDVDEIFHKYHYRMVPVVDRQDQLLGVIRSNDLIVPDQNG